MAETSTPHTIEPEEIGAIRGALRRYQVMAWFVGILLVVLVCVAVPMKYLWPDNMIITEMGSNLVTWIGLPHGWLYLVLLLTAYDLGRRVGWSITWFLLIMLAGTVPFLSFVAERFATRDVKAKLAAVEHDHT